MGPAGRCFGSREFDERCLTTVLCLYGISRRSSTLRPSQSRFFLPVKTQVYLRCQMHILKKSSTYHICRPTLHHHILVGAHVDWPSSRYELAERSTSDLAGVQYPVCLVKTVVVDPQHESKHMFRFSTIEHGHFFHPVRSSESSFVSRPR